MIFKINLIITVILLCIIFIGCYRKYREEKKGFNNGVCPHCENKLKYRGDVNDEQQWRCPGCGYIAYTGWFRR